MSYLHASLLRKRTMLIVRSFTILLLSCIAFKLACCFSSSISSLKALPLVGHLEFEHVHHASKDFGNRYQLIPLAVLHPKSVSDIASTIRHIWMMGTHSQLTVAARGRGHSLQGQAQTRHGIVIHMESLHPQKLQVYSVDSPAPYVDVSGGELWINILHETLKYGLAPKSWTDYLHLTVGGTLSNAGISGQAFRHGPQISNVHQLDFAAFAKDQEQLISAQGHKFDYIEGFVIINRTGLLNSWRLSFTAEEPLEASQFKSDGRTLYCLELAKYLKQDNKDVINKEVKETLSELSYVTSTLFTTEVAYEAFLDRVHVSEVKLRSKGQWEVPHPWLNLLVAILTSASPGSAGKDGVEEILRRNRRILEFSEEAGIGLKQYLPHYTTREEWRSHFGDKWGEFVRRKSRYDPLAILAPGHRIFQKAVSYS